MDSVTKLAPDFAEGWHMRAQLQLAAGDDAGAMISLQKTVALNPREFNALSHLADMLGEYGDKKGALSLYRKVQKLDPTNDDAARAVRKLTREVEGEKI
jgi:Flp pilus assembly protein TadD